MKTLLIILLLLTGQLYAKVDAFNYDFSLKILDDFSPGQKLSDIEKKYGKGEAISGQEDVKVFKFIITKLRYKFPVFVQFYKNNSTDYYTRLPSYFLHNIFHESLIKRLGPQTKYKKYEESASYYWKNAKGNKHYYRAECTITCFPIFYSVVTLKKDIPDYTPILFQMIKKDSFR